MNMYKTPSPNNRNISASPSRENLIGQNGFPKIQGGAITESNVINAKQGEDGFVLRYEENKRTGSYINQGTLNNNTPLFRPFNGNLANNTAQNFGGGTGGQAYMSRFRGQQPG